MRLSADIHRRADDFELDVLIESDADRIGILGESGSGKSMTLRSIAGIEETDYGRIEVNGRVLYDSQTKMNLKPQKRNVGYMFQNYALFPTMSVLRNVMAGLGRPDEEKRAKAMKMLRRFRMEGLENRLPGELSGGQQQRAALARIMVTEPELILLDEPFSALDAYLRDRMQLEMTEMLKDFPGQVLMVSHSRDELYRFSEELFVLQSGKVIRHGTTEDVFRDPGSVEAARLTGCKNFTRAEKTGDRTLRLTDWGLEVRLAKEIPDGIAHAGCRAHSFIPVWGERQDNCIRFVPVRTDELPFEMNYYFRPEHSESDSVHADDTIISWFVQSEEQKEIEKRGLPDWLRMNEEDILLL
ncbi:MAG: ATP-binding cassette domain-containing protein [Mogibacterium sp.]|nr:ATP-binding cassette domain-containing protein [Mogibacterium sp.]